ncbi:unnamed protein product [Spirodela intermedia]|uniref:Uncharacterized protein n=1 Tax=Spirodela intermedia TaxID=51605 RepID=A0A7I8LDM2_SPIIN|nr:unnamed protein product [Spirodela intermedia]
MTLGISSVEVAAGPAVAFEGHRAAAAAAAAATGAACVDSREFSLAAGTVGGEGRREAKEEEVEESPSSSIGSAEESSLSSSPSEEGEEEVQSKVTDGALGSMDSLEESLPVKRGLSNWFSGKSKSFACLSEAAALGSAKDMAKKENPFNKRRRILTTCKASWQRRASYAALNTSVLRALREDGVDHEDDDDDDDDEDGGGAASHPFQRKLDGAFRSPRSFSLTDLQHAELA